jgi:integrase
MGRNRQHEVPIRSDWQKGDSGCWSLSLGERGRRVRIFQRVPGGLFFRETWIEGRGRFAASLRCTDREEAKRRGIAFYLALGASDAKPLGRPLTLGALWNRYQQEATPYRMLTERTRKDRIASAKLLLAAFGPSKPVEHLTLSDVEHYVELRTRGVGWRDGQKTEPVRPRTVASELQVLRAVLLWGTRVRNSDGSWLLKEYPLRGLKLPREENPNRPVATYDRFQKLRETIEEFAKSAPQKRGRERWRRLELALVLAEATGARIGGIRGLRWSDISYSPPKIRWRAEHDKRGRERFVPLPAALAEEIRSFQTRLGGIGESWLFPTTDVEKPWPRELFGQLLKRAERKAKLEHLHGGLWHPFRRKWATERKHLPLVDVKAAGGWKDTNTLLTCYQHTSDESMLEVMESPKKLVAISR